MIIVKLLKNQISNYWEHIKYAAIQTDSRVRVAENKDAYCRSLLIRLMSGKDICWVCMDDERQKIKGLSITSLRKNMVDEHILEIIAVYAFSYTNDDEKILFINTLKKFAEDIGCNSIAFMTNNQTIIDTAVSAGFQESHRTYAVVVGG